MGPDEEQEQEETASLISGTGKVDFHIQENDTRSVSFNLFKTVTTTAISEMVQSLNIKSQNW